MKNDLNQFSIKSFPLYSSIRKANFIVENYKRLSKNYNKNIQLFIEEINEIHDSSFIRINKIEKEIEKELFNQLKELQNIVKSKKRIKIIQNQKIKSIIDDLKNYLRFAKKEIKKIVEIEDPEDSIYIGVDGGGSKSNALVINKKFNVLGKGKDGSSFPGAIGQKESTKNVLASINKALKEANLSKNNQRIKRICIGSAGIDSYKCHLDFIKSLNQARKKGLISYDEIFIIPDGLSAWFSAFNGEPGIIANGGTGDLVFGYNKNKDCFNNYLSIWTDWKKEIRLGGRMYGHHGALKVLELIEKGKETILTKVWIDAFKRGRLYPSLKKNKNIKKVLKIVINSSNSERVPVSEIAKGTEVLFRAALKGDDDAAYIIKQGAKRMAEYVDQIAKKIGLDQKNFKIAIFGSVIQDPYVSPIFFNELKKLQPNYKFQKENLYSDYGDAEIARKNIRFY
ncbi:MAG: hypothetical protein GF335_01140 [Candidatus Moranbacteria bacterium]|nr:hypothetical protein [Candidatus Moranbacteria bacterium]